MQICPHCASENIFFSKKRNMYFCEDCENSFDSPALEKGTRIFLSYGHDKNSAVVAKIKEFLTQQGYDVWIDTSEIEGGKDWRERITNGIIGSNGVISFLSKHSVRDPGVCLDELKIAVCLKRSYIQTVLLESEKEVSPPSMVCNTQWIDMSDWDSVPDKKWNKYFNDKMKQLVASLNDESTQTFNSELEFLCDKLKVYDNTAKEQRLIKHTFVGRHWLTEQVQNRFDIGFSRFMIYGVPGSGKSAFAANMSHYNPDVLASVFFEWDNTTLCNVDTFIRTLALKLAATLPDYHRMLCFLYSDKKSAEKMAQFHDAALFDLLILNPIQCCIDGGRGNGIIIFDGIDETSAEVADLIIQKSTQFPSWIKFLFTSRYDKSTAARFNADEMMILDISNEQNTADLKEYFAYRLGIDSDSSTACRLAEKSEGSFMYASAFCDAVDSKNLDLSDETSIPSGLNNFYYTFFKRLFKSKDEFLEIRPFLELLATDEDVPEYVISKSLGLDRYGLWDLRLTVKSLVTTTDSTCGSGNKSKLKAIKFVHKSIKDWITDQTLAGEFFVDETRGYRTLARFHEEILPTIQIKEYNTFELITADQNDPVILENLKLKGIKKYSENNYLKWLILSTDYDKAKHVLMTSFDIDQMHANYDFNNYLDYYKYLYLWQWADKFPAGYPVDDLVEKFNELTNFLTPLGVSRYTHRSAQVLMLTMRQIIDSGRFKDAFFNLLDLFALSPGYFVSTASDDIGETRDGWDKYFMARDAAVCLKKLYAAGIDVPDNIAEQCQQLKLTYNFYNRDHMGGMFYGDSDNGTWAYGILAESDLFKDVCILKDPDRMILAASAKQLQTHYNTTSMRFYLANSDEEDMDFIRLCVQNGADIKKACTDALKDIEKNSVHTANKKAELKNIVRRNEFIKSLMNSGI